MSSKQGKDLQEGILFLWSLYQMLVNNKQITNCFTESILILANCLSWFSTSEDKTQTTLHLPLHPGLIPYCKQHKSCVFPLPLARNWSLLAPELSFSTLIHHFPCFCGVWGVSWEKRVPAQLPWQQHLAVWGYLRKPFTESCKQSCFPPLTDSP